MADNNTLPEPKLRTEKYLNAIANNTAGGGGETAIIKKSKTITANGTYSALNEDFDGYEQVIANVPNSFTPADEGKVVSQGVLVSQSSTAANQNGTVDTTLYNSIDIDVPNTYTAGDEGKVVDNGHLVAQTSTSALQNGTINTTTNNEVVVNVPNTYVAADEGKVVSNGGLVSQTSTNINTNGTVNTTLNNEVVVAVPNTYAAGDEGKVVSNGALVGQTSTSITTNNTTVDTTLNNEVSVNITVPQPTLITKNIVLNGTYNASSDSADGYSSVDVQVPNTYAAADEGKVVSNGALVSQTSTTVTTNNTTVDTTLINSVDIAVPTSTYPYPAIGLFNATTSDTPFATLSIAKMYPTDSTHRIRVTISFTINSAQTAVSRIPIGYTLSDYFDSDVTITVRGIRRGYSNNINADITIKPSTNVVSFPAITFANTGSDAMIFYGYTTMYAKIYD